jgi:uncharacterized Tic20 family protein
MKNFIAYTIWSFLSLLGIKYSIEFGMDTDIGWISPLLAVYSLQMIFSVFALFIAVIAELKNANK